MARFSFIGMSGAGKSYWTRKLAIAGFSDIGIDDRIERKLTPELASGGHRGIEGLAAWMGWPDQTHYHERADKYLACEIESMQEALREIESSTRENIVLDTTGSVIYTGDEIFARMKRATTVVYFAASANEEKLLIERYLSDPKPVLWGDRFTLQPGETPQQAIARCYPELIAQRKSLYEGLADRVVTMSDLRSTSPNELSARGFLEFLENRAKARG